MTRLLSCLLAAKEPHFRLTVRELEQAAGGPSIDIQLSSAIIQQTKAKIRQLSLDPNDTTPKELFNALQQRLGQDDRLLRDYLGIEATATPTDILKRVVKFVSQLDIPLGCYALRPSVAKRLFKSVPPKSTMKRLGYRSLDSMLKHEPIAGIYAAASQFESATWWQSFYKQYGSLSPSDFESRRISLYLPDSKNWPNLSATMSYKLKQLSFVSKELGSIVILPPCDELPALTITSCLLMLSAVNSIRFSSTYLKMRQVEFSFGEAVKTVANGDPFSDAELAGQQLPWRVLQRFFDKFKDAYNPSLFEPHVQVEDMALAHAEQAISEHIPALSFWQGGSGLGLFDGRQVVSLNMLDVAISVANGLTFQKRVCQHFRVELWQQLLLSYLNQNTLAKVLDSLEKSPPELAAVAEEIE